MFMLRNFRDTRKAFLTSFLLLLWDFTAFCSMPAEEILTGHNRRHVDYGRDYRTDNTNPGFDLLHENKAAPGYAYALRTGKFSNSYKRWHLFQIYHNSASYKKKFICEKPALLRGEFCICGVEYCEKRAPDLLGFRRLPVAEASHRR